MLIIILSGTILSVLRLLQDKSRVLSFFDESGTFFGSLDRKNNSYDRSVYNSLFNSPKNYNRDVLNNQINLKDPCLNMCLLGHIEEYIQMLNSENSQDDDALMHRFLLNIPQPVFKKAKYIREANDNYNFSLSSIFYMLYKIHEVKREYSFQHTDKIDKIHDYFKDIIEKTHTADKLVW